MLPPENKRQKEGNNYADIYYRLFAKTFRFRRERKPTRPLAARPTGIMYDHKEMYIYVQNLLCVMRESSFAYFSFKKSRCVKALFAAFPQEMLFYLTRKRRIIS